MTRSRIEFPTLGPLANTLTIMPMCWSGDRSSIRGRVISKTQNMVLDDSFPYTQHYKVRIKSTCRNPRKGVAPSLDLGVVVFEKRAFRLPAIEVCQLYIYIYIYIYMCVCVCVCVWERERESSWKIKGINRVLRVWKK